MRKEQFDLATTINKIIDFLSKDYIFDYYIPNYTPMTGINLSKKDIFIENSLEIFIKNHPTNNTKKLYSLFDDYRNLIKKDIIIYYEKKQIYKELYKIIYLIDNTLEIQKFINNPDLYPKDFAEIQTDLKDVNELRYHNKKNIVGKYKQFNKKESKVKYWLSTLYVKNRKITKFFLYLYLLTDIESIKLLQNELNNQEEIEIILSVYKWFILQKTTINQVIKSLGILLYWEQVNFLKISKNDAEIYTQSIIYKLFNQDINFYEFHKYIWIKSSVYFPIFGASKYNPFKEEEINFIKKTLYKELSEISIKEDTFNKLFQMFIKNPHIQFLQKYPVELFRINTKYSS